MTRFLLLIVAPILLTGCLKYGTGSAIGYVYAVDDGIIWDKVWYKTSPDASQSDCYLVKNDELKERLKAISGKSKVKLTYSRHLFTVAACGGTENADNTNDEITAFEIL